MQSAARRWSASTTSTTTTTSASSTVGLRNSVSRCRTPSRAEVRRGGNGQPGARRPKHPLRYAHFPRTDCADADALRVIFEQERFDYVVHLAAQAGVRYSIDAPFEYVEANMRGFLSVLEAARAAPPRHLVYASTSSVYGLNGSMPFLRPILGQSPGVTLRCKQEGERGDGPRLQPCLRACDYGASVFHRLRSVGAPGHGAHQVCPGHQREGRPLTFTTRRDAERLHVRGRHCGRTSNRRRQCPDRRPVVGRPNGRPCELLGAPYRVYNIGRGEPVELMDFHQRARARVGQRSAEELYADAARRHGSHLGGHK